MKMRRKLYGLLAAVMAAGGSLLGLHLTAAHASGGWGPTHCTPNTQDEIGCVFTNGGGTLVGYHYFVTGGGWGYGNIPAMNVSNDNGGGNICVTHGVSNPTFVAVEGTNGHIYYITWGAGTWGPWVDLGTFSNGPDVSLTCARDYNNNTVNIYLVGSGGVVGTKYSLGSDVNWSSWFAPY